MTRNEKLAFAAYVTKPSHPSLQMLRFIIKQQWTHLWMLNKVSDLDKSCIIRRGEVAAPAFLHCGASHNCIWLGRGFGILVKFKIADFVCTQLVKFCSDRKVNNFFSCWWNGQLLCLIQRVSLTGKGLVLPHTSRWNGQWSTMVLDAREAWFNWTQWYGNGFQWQPTNGETINWQQTIV